MRVVPSATFWAPQCDCPKQCPATENWAAGILAEGSGGRLGGVWCKMLVQNGGWMGFHGDSMGFDIDWLGFQFMILWWFLWDLMLFHLANTCKDGRLMRKITRKTTDSTRKHDLMSDWWWFYGALRDTMLVSWDLMECNGMTSCGCIMGYLRKGICLMG